MVGAIGRLRTPATKILWLYKGLLNAPSKPLLYSVESFRDFVLHKGVGDRNAANLLPILKVFAIKNVATTFDR